MTSHSSQASKTAFYTGHNGTTLHEINAIVGLVPLVAFLFDAVKSVWIQRRNGRSGSAASCTPPMMPAAAFAWQLAEICALVVPQIAVMMELIQPAIAATVAASLALIVSISNVAMYVKSPQSVRDNIIQRAATSIGMQRARFISNYRGAMMLSTCIAILAVDFPAFPRRFVKSDSFGSGLMDVGVGSFVFASGLVAASATKRPSWSRASSLHVVALVILGVGRLVATRGVGYHEVASEYGVHWNFFFTLAAVKIITTIAAVPPHLALPAGLAVMAIHEASLTGAGLYAVVHTDARGLSLWSLNKEGLLSLPGYWGLHLLAAGVGGILHSSRSAALHLVQRAVRDGGSPWKPLARWYWCWCAVTLLSWAAAGSAIAVIAPISRRACNLPYVLWMLAFNLQVAMAFAAGTFLTMANHPSLFDSLNKHSLPVFLAANLFTGILNISINTLNVQAWPARAIVTCYSAALCYLACFMSKCSVLP